MTVLSSEVSVALTSLTMSSLNPAQLIALTHTHRIEYLAKNISAGSGLQGTAAVRIHYYVLYREFSFTYTLSSSDGDNGETKGLITPPPK